ncbi:hypothetical protein V2J09_014610 [Rumex salicifolius]
MLKLIINGVQINEVLRRRSLTLYSTAVNSLQQPLNPLADYLVKSLELSREEAVAASKKVSSLKSLEKPIAVINFLKQNGFEQSRIKKIILHDARLLASRDINKTLCPKIRVFQELGLSDSELGRVMALNPWILLRGLNSHIKPPIECLRSILGSDEYVTKAIQRNPMLVTYKPRRFISNASLLRSYGLSGKKLTSLVLYNPWNLICQTELLEKKLKDVETVLEIPRESNMFLYGMYVFSSLSRDTIESKIRVFRSYGWTEEEIKKLVRSLPGCLRISETKIRMGLDYYMKELSYEAGHIARFPNLMSFSLKNRVLPRRELWEALIKKNLISKVSFNHFVYMPELRFLDYIMPFKDHLPKLFDSYMKNSLSSSSSSSVALAK